MQGMVVFLSNSLPNRHTKTRAIYFYEILRHKMFLYQLLGFKLLNIKILGRWFEIPLFGFNFPSKKYRHLKKDFSHLHPCNFNKSLDIFFYIFIFSKFLLKLFLFVKKNEFSMKLFFWFQLMKNIYLIWDFFGQVCIFQNSIF